jgi:hypothetical protein
VAIKTDGSVKLKGAFARTSLAKNPRAEICTTAVIRRLTAGTPVEVTVGECEDIRQFLVLRKVQGGALDQLGLDCGKTVRWYYSSLAEGPLTYRVNGYKVPDSDGAMPCPELPAELPSDLDREWYIAEATVMLESLGVGRRQGELLHAA